MRCFIAIPVPDYIKDYALKIRNRINEGSPDIKWVEYENYHLTLKFLGDVEPDCIEAVKNQLDAVAGQFSLFSLQVKGMGFFPNKRSPRVLWLGIRGEINKARILGERVDASLAKLEFEHEKNRSFHLTLGRIRSDYNLEKVVNEVEKENNEPELLTFKVDEFKLMQSHLTPRGPRYEVIGSFKLKE